MSIIIFILILGVLIFVHELGHFAVAKFFGIRVDEFGMGFPPRAVKLFSRNGTDYTLNWIPFGGFVKIYGEDSMDRSDPDFNRSLVAKAWWKQILVLAAGVTMNVILAWVLLTGTYLVGAPVPASQVSNPEELKNIQLTILEVKADAPADRAGLRSGDVVKKLSRENGILTNATPEGFTEFIQSTPEGGSVTISVERGKKPQDIIVVPDHTIAKERQAIGVVVDNVGTSRLGFFPSIAEGARTTYHSIVGTIVSLGRLIGGKESLSGVTGPVGLVGVVHDAQKVGIASLMILIAIISINLAVINLVPFPALDGGRILFTLIETIIRRPLPKKVVEWTNGIGFIILILLMVVITVKDVIKLF